MRIEKFALAATTLCALLASCHARGPGSAATPGCLPTGDGYLRARLRGAQNVDIDWNNAQMQCDGGPRPDNRGLRVTFAGPLPDGHRLRFVFGVSQAQAGAAARDVPANVTLIVEGAQQLFSTAGDDKCTVDAMTQQRLPADGKIRRYRMEVRGFCTAPAGGNGGASVLVSRFDFAGPMNFEDEAAATPPSTVEQGT